MTKKQITKEFLTLFSKNWDDPIAHQGFKQLRERVAGQGQWPAIIDARLMALEKKTAESIKLLQDIVTRDHSNFCASLLLARILCTDDDRPGEAYVICDSLLHQGFHDQPLPDWLEISTMFYKGVALAEMGKPVEAIRVHDDVAVRFAQSANIDVLDNVASSLIEKGLVLGNIGMSEEEIRAYDDVVARFGESVDLLLRKQVARALINKGITLGEMNKPEEEIRIYDDVVKRFE